MTYYLKYLKYKNKYLELKKLIGGAKKLDLTIIQTLWNEMSEKKKVYKVLDDDKDIFIEYCWIGSKLSDLYDNGYGFFIYSIDKQQTKNKKLDKFTKIGDYAIKILTKNNLDKVYPYSDSNVGKYYFESKNDIKGENPTGEKNCEGDDNDKICFDVEETVVKIKKGTKCDWFQFENTDKTIFKAWIYNSTPVQYILYRPDN